MKRPHYKVTKRVPEWVRNASFRLVVNNIDGWAHYGDETFADWSDLIRRLPRIVNKRGCGEYTGDLWAVKPGARPYHRHPYGLENPFRSLSGGVRKLFSNSYMDGKMRPIMLTDNGTVFENRGKYQIETVTIVFGR